jgi:hypothetical protein
MDETLPLEGFAGVVVVMVTTFPNWKNGFDNEIAPPPPYQG